MFILHGYTELMILDIFTGIAWGIYNCRCGTTYLRINDHFLPLEDL